MEHCHLCNLKEFISALINCLPWWVWLIIIFISLMGAFLIDEL